MLQVDKSPSITWGGYDKKMKEKIESKSIPTKESTVKDKMYLLESIGNDTITTKTLQERLPDREWKILATDLNLLMEKGFVTAIVGNSKLIETTYTASTKGKELLWWK